MINESLLEAKILEAGKKKKHLAKMLGISQNNFKNKCTNRAQFTISQVDVLCRELNIVSLQEKEDIFFSKKGA